MLLNGVSVLRFCVAAIGLVLCTITRADVTVSGQTLSWPDNGWYQVQSALTFATICEGTRACNVFPGTYHVINHSTGQRWENIAVEAGSPAVGDPVVPDPAGGAPTVVGSTISWSGDGWHQVQNQVNFASICEGGSSCNAEPGTYVVINHSSGQRWENIVVGESSAQPGGESPVTVSGTTLSWSLSGWVQVQDAQSYATLCEGGTTCEVPPGNYILIDHSSGERYEDIRVSAVGVSDPVTTNPPESPVDESWAATRPTVNGSVITFGTADWHEVQNAENFRTVCEGTNQCSVSTGTYTVINHANGNRWGSISVESGGGATPGTPQPDPVRNPPLFQPVDNQRLVAGYDFLNLRIRAYSDTGFPMLSEQELPSGATVYSYEPGTLDLDWFPERGDEGSYTFAFIATDPVNSSVTTRLEFQVIVEAAPNEAPYLQVVGSDRNYVLPIGDAWSVDFEAIDADDDALEFILTASPAGLNLSPTSNDTATLTWTPDVSDEGFHELLISVRDEEYASDVRLNVQVVAGCQSNESGSRLGVDCLPEQFGQRVTDSVESYQDAGPMRGIGDINGDGYDDVVLVSPLVEYLSYEPFELRRYGYVLFGSPAGLPSDVNPGLITSQSGFNLQGQREFGLVDLHGIGDIDGDGYADLAVVGESDTITIVYGRAQFPRDLDIGNLEPDASLRIVGLDDSPIFRPRIGSTGDFNGDGIDDYYVSVYDSNYLTVNPERVIFGTTNRRTGNLLFSTLASPDAMQIKLVIRRPSGPDGGEEVEARIDYAGDVNNDGYSDLVVRNSGSYGMFILYGSASNEALVTLEEGVTDSRYTQFELAQNDPLRVEAISGGGDINGDGFADIAFTATGIPDYSINAIYVMPGSTNRPEKFILAEADSTQLIQIDPRTRSPGIHGESVAFVGDFNGDGYDDLAVGDAVDYGESSSGGDNSVYILPGASNLQALHGSTLGSLEYTRVRGSFEASRIGEGINAGGDINGDGFSDVLLDIEIVGYPLNRSASETAVIFGR